MLQPNWLMLMRQKRVGEVTQQLVEICFVESTDVGADEDGGGGGGGYGGGVVGDTDVVVRYLAVEVAVSVVLVDACQDHSVLEEEIGLAAAAIAGVVVVVAVQAPVGFDLAVAIIVATMAGVVEMLVKKRFVGQEPIVIFAPNRSSQSLLGFWHLLALRVFPILLYVALNHVDVLDDVVTIVLVHHSATNAQVVMIDVNGAAADDDSYVAATNLQIAAADHFEFANLPVVEVL